MDTHDSTTDIQNKVTRPSNLNNSIIYNTIIEVSYNSTNSLKNDDKVTTDPPRISKHLNDEELATSIPSLSTSTQVASLKKIATSFGLMGWTAFGGPAAHIGYFNKTFVLDTDTPWMSPGVFSELLALGQCLPGPTSTQMSFAMGITQRGTLGGLLSGFLFQYPGLVLMTLGGAGAAEVLVTPSSALKGFTAGLSAAGVALVVSAADGLARSQGGKTLTTKILCGISATVAYYYASAWLFPSLIAFGGVITYVESVLKSSRGKNQKVYETKDDNMYKIRKEQEKNYETAEDVVDNVANLGLTPLVGGILLSFWIASLITLGVLVANTEYEGNKELHWFEAFWRTGSIIFGGGQVVLPLLLNDVVQYDTSCVTNTTLGEECLQYVESELANSWVTEEQFFTGLAMAQAMPGPLFNLSAFLGAVIARRAGISVIIGVLCSWFGLFGPGILLIFSVLPFWGMFRRWTVYKHALSGLNASAVGLIVAAMFQIAFKVKSISPFPNASVCIGIICTFCAHIVHLPRGMWSLIQAPLVILLGGLLGYLAYVIDMH